MKIRFLIGLTALAVVIGIAMHRPAIPPSRSPGLDKPAPARAPLGSGAPHASIEAPPAPDPVAEMISRLRSGALARSDPVAREAFLGQAVKGVPRALYGHMAAALKDAPPRSLEAELLRAVLLRWAWSEPANAAEWAVEQTDHPYRKEALAFAAQGWARQEPEQLLMWAADLAPADRAWVLLRSGDFLGRTDPSLFAVWQQAMPPGRERDELMLAISREWAGRDPEKLVAALAENAGTEFEEWRRLTVAGLTTRLATMSGPDAARFATEKLPPGPGQRQAVMGAVAAWAHQDPVAASHWIDRFPEEELRAQASEVLIGHWLAKDVPAAQAYARTLPPGPVADTALQRVAQFLSGHQGADAISWAEGIADPERRQQTLGFVLAEVSREDPEGLRVLLARRPELASLVPGAGHE